MRTRVDPPAAFAYRELPQRPQHEIFLAADWFTGRDLDLRVEVRDVGDAFDIDSEGSAVALRSQTELNLRATVPLFKIGPNHRAALIVAVDNVTNALIEPQLGSPLAGRTWHLGIRYRAVAA